MQRCASLLNRAIDQEFNCELRQFKAAILPPEDTNRTGDTNRTEADVDIRTGSGFINYINGYVSAGDTNHYRAKNGAPSAAVVHSCGRAATRSNAMNEARIHAEAQVKQQAPQQPKNHGGKRNGHKRATSTCRVNAKAPRSQGRSRRKPLRARRAALHASRRLYIMQAQTRVDHTRISKSISQEA